MIPRFSLVRPTTLDEAFAAHSTAEGDAAYLAGGTELLQVMKMGFAQFGTLVDLKRLPELRGIARNGVLRIGAGVTHREIERSSIVAEAVPGLVALERRVANTRVRNTGTLGGNLAFAEPHSDPATFLLACGAAVEIAGPTGTRTVRIADFVIGPLTTTLEPGEILVAIFIPLAVPGEGRAYEKLAFFERPAASVAVRLVVADGAIGDATVAVGSITEAAVEIPEAGEALRGIAANEASVGRAAAEIAAGAFGSLEAVADLNGSADYKRHLAGVLLKRAARGALAEALVRA